MSGAVKFNRFGKFDLNPRGNLWLKDESRFGHKLLSKMGWSQGKGLGKNEDGIKENLKVKVNTQNAGVGWTEKFPLAVETAEYDAVLANLNKKFNNSSSNKSDEENQTTSIEKRSQEFKKRLHYGKFVRGKDVGRYSEKDFNSIFVTKMPKSEPKTVVESNITNVECPKETTETTTTFKSSLSMKDYFDMKMKKKSDTTDDTAAASEDPEVEEPGTQNGFPEKRKNKKKKHKLNSEESCQEGDSQDNSLKVSEVECITQEQILKRKKSKKGLSKSKKIKLDPDLEEKFSNGIEKDNEDVIQVYEMIQLDASIGADKTGKKKKPKKGSDKEKPVNIKSEINEDPSNTTVEHYKSTVEASHCEIITLENEKGLNGNQDEVSSEVIEKVSKKRKRKKSKGNPIEIDLSDDSTSSSSANEKEPQTDAAENSTLPEDQPTISKRKKLKAKRSQKLSTSVINCLKTCLRSTQTYAVEKEARRVSFSEQVHCRLLNTLIEEGATEVKSEINDIVLPCVNKSADEAEEVVERTESTVKNGAEEITQCEESQRTLDEEVEGDESTPNCLILPKSDNSNYNSWLENQRIASKMKVYKTMVKKIKKNPVLMTTNLLDIKGYGNWGF